MNKKSFGIKFLGLVLTLGFVYYLLTGGISYPRIFGETVALIIRPFCTSLACTLYGILIIGLLLVVLSGVGFYIGINKLLNKTTKKH